MKDKLVIGWGVMAYATFIAAVVAPAQVAGTMAIVVVVCGVAWFVYAEMGGR